MRGSRRFHASLQKMLFWGKRRPSPFYLSGEEHFSPLPAFLLTATEPGTLLTSLPFIASPLPNLEIPKDTKRREINLGKRREDTQKNSSCPPPPLLKYGCGSANAWFMMENYVHILSHTAIRTSSTSLCPPTIRILHEGCRPLWLVTSVEAQ